MKQKLFLFTCLSIILLPVFAEAQPLIKDILVSKKFFNPTIAERIDIEFDVALSGILTIQLLDRDGYVVRHLMKSKKINAGKQKQCWDGLDESGQIVPDEAFSIKIAFDADGKKFTYFPAAEEQKELTAEIGYYDRSNRILTYKLPQPARVHIQAGSAVIDPKTKKALGPVLKTVVNREPRTGGSLVQPWTGYSDDNSIYIPDLPNFVFSISATALPENAILTTGNRNLTFLDSIKNRTGKSLLPDPSQDHKHHRGLTTLEDISPEMTLTPVNAKWSSTDKAWLVEGNSIEVMGSLEGPTASNFLKQPVSLGIFVNEKMVLKTGIAELAFRVKVPLPDLPAGLHYVALNLGSEFGPVSVNAFRIKKEGRKKS
ncbi:hypothetical protein L0222_21660 [bacterium]|nr:hypothetical protein [bacterium]MCI0605745.1 hypothetical protein [bacterium]